MRSLASIAKAIKSAGNVNSVLATLAIDNQNQHLAIIRQIIDKADALYYRPGLVSPLSDADYDAIRAHLKELDPNDERLSRVGPPYSAADLDTKVPHNIPMGSLDNTDNGIAGYEPWLDWLHQKLGYLPAIHATLKVDGGSICATYKAGKLVRVVTRGNGMVGEDITANAVNFQHLPSTLPRPIDIDVRGEAVLPIADFKMISERDSGLPFDKIPDSERGNPRNDGNGIIGRHNGADSELIHFMAFNLFGVSVETEEEKWAELRNLGFTPVPGKHCATVADFNDFYKSVLLGRDRLPFEIDGIVVVMNNIADRAQFITDERSLLRPKFARAVKFDTKTAITKLAGVNVTVGHTGAIIPTAILDTVRIGGVNVSNVLLNNWDEVLRFDLAIGDEVVVGLAGDIIPKIYETIKRKKTIYRCPKCGFVGDETAQNDHHLKAI